MFAKTRAQNIDIWPNGGHFCDDEYFLRFPKTETVVMKLPVRQKWPPFGQMSIF